jgi:hypothetical protein
VTKHDAATFFLFGFHSCGTEVEERRMRIAPPPSPRTHTHIHQSGGVKQTAW